MLDRSRSRNRSKTGDPFSPAGLFVTGAQGAWYDPSDYSTLFQDAAGTTPVTAVEQPVRLMLDRSRGLVLGAEQRSTGAAGLQGTATAATFNATTFAGAATRVDVTNQSFVVFSGFTPNVLVQITVECLTGFALIRSSTLTGAGGSSINIAAGTTVTSVIQATATGTMGVASTANGTTSTFIVHSVRELPGNHAVAPNDASRPVLRARYNQLTFSEQFDNAVWTKTNSTVTANAAVAPDGTTTAEKVIADNANNIHQVDQSATIVANTTYTFSAHVKKGEYDFAAVITGASGGAGLSQRVAVINLATGALESETVAGMTTITVLANGWYRVAVTTAQTSGTGAPGFRIAALSTSAYISYTGDGTSGILIWGAQLLTAADAAATGNAYQRIAAATDYDVSNPVFRPYLAFDGSDDVMNIASSIHDVYQNVGNGTMWAGYTSIQTGVPVIFVSRNVNTSPRAGINSSGATGRRLDADSTANALDSGYAANAIYVATTVSDWAGGNIIRRTNGVQVASAAYSSGAGNTSNTASAQASLGANAANLLTGRLYSAIILGRAATDAELTATESWINGKTGGY